ncbi:hypothetical protein BD310DRAFT_922494 [Dichomitus squalens]|uniref:Uncharacterized protein n=1 Tax=Dichomitus squalens TaxID=114155 RepID=A0A4Q9Q1H7_9APHY|nr:hypothetical protein BD310DRAFT_922494 [Dichomitus squalens]
MTYAPQRYSIICLVLVALSRYSRFLFLVSRTLLCLCLYAQTVCAALRRTLPSCPHLSSRNVLMYYVAPLLRGPHTVPGMAGHIQA